MVLLHLQQTSLMLLTLEWGLIGERDNRVWQHGHCYIGNVIYLLPISIDYSTAVCIYKILQNASVCVPFICLNFEAVSNILLNNSSHRHYSCLNFDGMILYHQCWPCNESLGFGKIHEANDGHKNHKIYYNKLSKSWSSFIWIMNVLKKI